MASVTVLRNKNLNVISHVFSKICRISYDRHIKRCLDIILSIPILFFISLPMVFIAVVIKATSNGPVIFKQLRNGYKNEPFWCYKFRTMTVTECTGCFKQATKNDKRITKIGKFLRKTSLDELPQIFNVLKGEMSLVGPRPHAVTQNTEYAKIIPGYYIRHMVKPGITGWAQVNGWRGETDELYKMENRVDCDVIYIRKQSLYLDMKILFLTIFGRKTHRNAY